MKPSHQLTKNHHEYVPPQPAADPLEGSGYVEREYQHQEYPKVLSLKDPDGKDLVARDEEHEAELVEKYGLKEAEAAE